MPVFVLDLTLSLESKEDLSVETLTIDQEEVTITNCDVSIVDSSHVEVEITYST